MSIEIGILAINTIAVVTALIISWLAYLQLKTTHQVSNEQKGLIKDTKKILTKTKKITTMTHEMTTEMRDSLTASLDIQRANAMRDLLNMVKDTEKPWEAFKAGLQMYGVTKE